MTNLLSRLKMWQKLAVLLGLAILAFLVPTTRVFLERSEQLAVARQELAGVAPTNAAIGVLQVLQAHRGTTNLMLNGNSNVANQREALQGQLQTRISAVSQALEQIPHKDQWAAWQKDWSTLLEGVTKGTIAPQQAFAKHVALVDGIMDMAEDVADHFGLTLDPTAEGYFLQNALVIPLPRQTEGLALMRGQGSGYLTAKTIGQVERAALISLQREVDQSRLSVSNQLRKAFEVEPNLKKELEPALQIADAASLKFLSAVKTDILEPGALTTAPTDFFAKGSAAVDAQYALSAAGFKALERVLREREAALVQVRLTAVILSVAILVVLLGLGTLIVLSITRPLGQAVVAAIDISVNNDNR